MIHVEVKKGENESSASLLRRFSKKTQSASIVKKAKKLRYWGRARSEYVIKRNALRRIERGKERERLRKLGKINDFFGNKPR